MNPVRPPDRWLVAAPSTAQTLLRLFCLPYAGGGASIYRTWPNELPAEIQVYAVQLPGRENRMAEPPYTHVTPLGRVLAEQLEPLLEMPYALFGHSMGALIAFELTRELRRRRLPLPVHLFVSAHRAPQIPHTKPPIHHLPDAEFVQEIRKLKGTPEDVLVHEELMELMLPRLRADFTLFETYTYEAGEPLAVPLSVYGGIEDEDVRKEWLEAWREQTQRSMNLHLLPGHHFFIQESQQELLEIIAQALRPYF